MAIAAAVAFSAFLALSLSPMLASKILKPASNNGWLAHKVDVAMDGLKDSYANSLGMMVGKRMAVVGVAALILLVGGGAAGCEAARVAATRGHKVTLLEQGKRLGGQLLIAARAPGHGRHRHRRAGLHP